MEQDDGGKGEGEGLNGLQVDDLFELHILLDWQVRGVRLRQYGTTAVLRVTEEG